MRRSVLFFASATAAMGCSSSSLPEPMVPLDQIPAFVVRSSDFDSASFAMLDAEGEPIYEAWITSGVTPVGLTTAIHSDSALPTVDQGGGVLTIIDRYGADRITRFQFPEGTVLGQMRTQGPETSKGWSSNPHDVVYLSATRALVSRFGHNDDDSNPLDAGTDLLEFDPSTMTLTGERIDLRAFDAEVEFESDDGPVTLVAHAQPERMVKTGNGFVVVGLTRLTPEFEAAAPGMVAIVDLATDAVTGHDLAPLTNCGVVLPVPGHPNRVAVRCLGFGTSKEKERTSGVVVLEIDDDGGSAEVAAFRGADHEGGPIPVASVLPLTGRLFVGVDNGVWEDRSAPDEIYLVDIETGEATHVLGTRQGFDIMGSMAWNETTGVVLVPSRSEGLHRFHFDGGALVYEDTIRLVPHRLGPVSVATME